VPVLNARLVDKDGVLVEALDAPADSGVAAADYVAADPAVWANGEAASNIANGVYGVKKAADIASSAS